MGVLAVIVVIAIVFALAMLASGLVVAISGAWFLHVPFGESWSMAWERPGMLLLMALVISIIFGVFRANN